MADIAETSCRLSLDGQRLPFRSSKMNRMRKPIVPRVGEESVWGYPRPPRLEKVQEKIRVVFAGETITDRNHALRVLETSHPPVYYLPLQDVRSEFLVEAPGQSFCEFKGVAKYWSLNVNGIRSERAAWSYPNPTPEFVGIRDYVAFYASRVNECWVGDERVRPQSGDFYGGWITSRIVGPFKGGEGTLNW